MKSIGENAFYGCPLTEVVLNSNAIVSKNYSYSDKDNLHYTFGSVNKFILGEGVTSIGEYAFYECNSLKSVTIPNSVTSIGENAFKGCSCLKKVIIPDIASWCKVSFSGSYSNPLSYAHHIYSNEETEIMDLVIPNSVSSIGNNKFSGCSSLTSVTIPNSVTSIESGAFENCSSLQKVIITDIAAWCKIHFSGTNSNPLSYAHYLYSNEETEITDLVIPESVSNIGSYAFSNCSGLESVTIPNSITSIGNYTFSGCNGLTSVTIPNSVTSIGNYAYLNCSSLSSIMIGNSVSQIGMNSFSGCTDVQAVVSFAPVSVVSSFSNSVNAEFWLLPSLVQTNDNRIHKIVDCTTTQSTITAKPSEIIEIESIETEGKSLSCFDGIFKIEGIFPDHKYPLSFVGKINGETYTFTDNISTKSIPLHLDYIDATNHTIKVSHYYEGDAVIVKEGVRYMTQYGSSWNDWLGPDATCITNLKPGKNYTVQYYVMAKDEKEYRKSITCSTKPLDYSS